MIVNKIAGRNKQWEKISIAIYTGVMALGISFAATAATWEMPTPYPDKASAYPGYSAALSRGEHP